MRSSRTPGTRTRCSAHVSVKTVQYHPTHIHAKFGIRSRGELAARFREDVADEEQD